ncbi:hypothetical protein [Polaromonas sp. CG_9.11]|uniref:hypothetical protein n=1 Tax=Polaromonas sp. CG_9.11 TaxID=2787730 RepID=UPI0018CA98B2|nr:hypothetical protein [Polaromonas sp. CG_9.11]MBG6074221.1 hypothetical protein [Polaromonas sp. CG_9.11]
MTRRSEHLRCECDSHRTSNPATEGTEHCCAAENGAQLQEITPGIPHASLGPPTIWDIRIFDALIKLNSMYGVEDMAFLLLNNSLFLTCAKNSRGWRHLRTDEESQVLALVDAELAMRAIAEIFP